MIQETILQLGYCLKADIIKLKGSKLTAISIIGISLFPIIVFCMFYLKNEYFISNMSSSSLWYKYFASNFRVASTFLLPFYVILASSLLHNIEHNSDGWKSILCLPYFKTTLYLSKLILFSCFVLIVYTIFVLIVVFLGFVLGVFITEYSLTFEELPLTYVLEYLIISYISILGILSIHNVLSLTLKNQIPVIGIGLLFVIISSIFYSYKWMLYFPHAYSTLTTNNTFANFSVKLLFGLPSHQWLSIVYFFAFAITGGIIFNYKQIK